jgi:hypothetical protein
VDVEVEDVKAELRTDWLGRRRGGTAGGARRSAAELAVDEGGAKCAALSEWRALLGRPLGAWRLGDAVGADRRGRRRRTADTWPDTRRRAVSDETESRDSVAANSD